jgi:hypothetical protein
MFMINKQKSVYTVHGPCLYTHVHTARALERGFWTENRVTWSKNRQEGRGGHTNVTPRIKKGARRTIKRFSKHLSGVIRMVMRLQQVM